jgi:hypothetical protein
MQKKPVIQLKAASAINRIMVLCDSTLSLLNMLNLEVGLNVLSHEELSIYVPGI